MVAAMQHRGPPMSWYFSCGMLSPNQRAPGVSVPPEGLRFLDQAFIQDLTERKLVEVALREMPNYGELGPTHPSSQ